MSVITSRDSKTFKELQRLTQKKYRDRGGLFIAEGPNVTMTLKYCRCSLKRARASSHSQAIQ